MITQVIHLIELVKEVIIKIQSLSDCTYTENLFLNKLFHILF